MERLTYDCCINGHHCWQVKGADNRLCSSVCADHLDSKCDLCPIGKAFNRLAYYEDLEEQGRLMVLPCKVGASCFAIERDSGFNSKKALMRVKGKRLCRHTFRLHDIYKLGKTVFLTREEAEAALERKQ